MIFVINSLPVAFLSTINLQSLPGPFKKDVLLARFELVAQRGRLLPGCPQASHFAFHFWSCSVCLCCYAWSLCIAHHFHLSICLAYPKYKERHINRNTNYIMFCNCSPALPSTLTGSPMQPSNSEQVWSKLGSQCILQIDHKITWL